MKILLTGATGFTGSHVLRLLRAEGLEPRCLVRGTTRAESLRAAGVELIVGDVGDAASMARALDGVDVLLNTVSLGFGHAPEIVEAAERAAVRRALFISTTAIFTTLNAPSKAVRTAAEQTIQRSSLAYTILRPTMVYGTTRDRNMTRLIRVLDRWRVIPILGSGKSLQQPVYVADVAEAIVKALRSERSIRQAYNIPGGAALTFNEVIDTIGRLLGKHIRKVHVPGDAAVAALRVAERARLRLPIKSEQILRLNEDKAFSFADAARDFGYEPITFAEGISRQLKEMGLLRSP